MVLQTTVTLFIRLDSTITASTLYSLILNINTVFYFPWTELGQMTQYFEKYLKKVKILQCLCSLAHTCQYEEEATEPSTARVWSWAWCYNWSWLCMLMKGGLYLVQLCEHLIRRKGYVRM